jgi:hypothetical protein
MAHRVSVPMQFSIADWRQPSSAASAAVAAAAAADDDNDDEEEDDDDVKEVTDANAESTVSAKASGDGRHASSTTSAILTSRSIHLR